MAIAGVDTQSGSQLAALRNTQQTRTDESRSQQEAQAARFGTTDATQTEDREARFGTESNVAERQGFGIPGTSLDSQSLSTVIQATQEANDDDAQAALAANQDEERQEDAEAGTVTNSLAPGTANGQANGTADPRGVSFLV